MFKQILNRLRRHLTRAELLKLAGLMFVQLIAWALTLYMLFGLESPWTVGTGYN